MHRDFGRERQHRNPSLGEDENDFSIRRRSPPSTNGENSGLVVSRNPTPNGQHNGPSSPTVSNSGSRRPSGSGGDGSGPLDDAEHSLDNLLEDIEAMRLHRRHVLRCMVEMVPASADEVLEPHTERLGRRLDALRDGVLVGVRLAGLARRDGAPPDKVRLVAEAVRRYDADAARYVADLRLLDDIVLQGLDCSSDDDGDDNEGRRAFGDLLAALTSFA